MTRSIAASRISRHIDVLELLRDMGSALAIGAFVILRVLVFAALTKIAFQSVAPLALASARETSPATPQAINEQLVKATDLIRAGQFYAAVAVTHRLLAQR